MSHHRTHRGLMAARKPGLAMIGLLIIVVLVGSLVLTSVMLYNGMRSAKEALSLVVEANNAGNVRDQNTHTAATSDLLPPDIAYAGDEIIAGEPKMYFVADEYRSQDITTFGTTPITYTIQSGFLPSGLSLDASTGVLSGTPSSAVTGIYRILVGATNVVGDDEKWFRIDVPICGEFSCTLPN